MSVYEDLVRGEDGRLRPLNASSGQYVASMLAKSGQAICLGLTGHNSKAATQFVQVHDSNVLPAEGAVPEVMFLVAAGSSFAVDFGEHGRTFDRGIYVCNSSTGPTKTIGAADCWFDVQFV